MTVELWHLELSHFNEKARWALDLKAVPHRLHTPPPGLHGPLAMVLTRSGHRRLPVLRIDGVTVAGSAAIIAALDERFTEPRLIPEDSADRALALEHQAYFDDRLGPAVRAFAYAHVLREVDNFADIVAPEAGRLSRLAYGLGTPLARRAIRMDFGAAPERAAEHRASILAAADRVEEALSGAGYLVGDTFSVADLAGAALFTPLICPPERPYAPRFASAPVNELREELEARPAGQWVHEMYARHRGSSHALAV